MSSITVRRFAVPLAGLVILLLTWGGLAAIYPSIQTTVQQVAAKYPAGLKEAFDVQTLNTVEGYVQAEMFSLIVPLAMGYFAIRAVSGATVGAEERGYLDTILALPVSRTVLIAGSYVVAAVICAAIMALTGAMTFIVGVSPAPVSRSGFSRLACWGLCRWRCSSAGSRRSLAARRIARGR